MNTGTQTDTCTPMFIVALFPRGKKWKQLKYISTNETINKMWYIHTLEHYSGIKKNGIVLHATAWTNLKNITQ